MRLKPFEPSERELAVLRGIVRGDRDRDIALHLGVSHWVVRDCGVVLRKELGARTRTEVAVHAMRFGYLEP